MWCCSWPCSCAVHVADTYCYQGCARYSKSNFATRVTHNAAQSHVPGMLYFQLLPLKKNRWSAHDMVFVRRDRMCDFGDFITKVIVSVFCTEETMPPCATARNKCFYPLPNAVTSALPLPITCIRCRYKIPVCCYVAWLFVCNPMLYVLQVFRLFLWRLRMVLLFSSLQLR